MIIISHVYGNETEISFTQSPPLFVLIILIDIWTNFVSTKNFANVREEKREKKISSTFS